MFKSQNETFVVSSTNITVNLKRNKTIKHKNKKQKQKLPVPHTLWHMLLFKRLSVQGWEVFLSWLVWFLHTHRPAAWEAEAGLRCSEDLPLAMFCPRGSAVSSTEGKRQPIYPFIYCTFMTPCRAFLSLSEQPAMRCDAICQHTPWNWRKFAPDLPPDETFLESWTSVTSVFSLVPGHQTRAHLETSTGQPSSPSPQCCCCSAKCYVGDLWTSSLHAVCSLSQMRPTTVVLLVNREKQ